MLTPVLTPLLVALLATGFAGTESYLGPSLSLNFSENSYSMGSVGQQPVSYAATALITFTRPTSAWEWDWQGNYSEVAANVPRIAHDPLTKSTSTTPQTLGTGSYTFAVTYQYPVGKAVRVSADANNWMVGRVTASTPDSVTILVSAAPVGAGTYSAWTLIVRRGIRVEEQRVNKVLSAGDPMGTGWYNVNCTHEDSGQRFSNFVGTRIMSAGQTWHRRVMAGTPMAVSAQECVTILYRVGSSGRVRVVCRDNTRVLESVVSGVPGSLSATSSAGLVTILVDSQITADGIRQLSIGFTAAVPANQHEFSVSADSAITGQDVILFFAQLESASAPSTPIPTGASQVIRAGDLPLVNTLAPWYNASKGTLVVSYLAPAITSSATYPGIAALSDGTSSNRIGLFNRADTGSAVAKVSSGGVVQVDSAVPGTFTSGSRMKTALSYELNSFAACTNGGAILSDNSGVVPTVDRLLIGIFDSQANGIIESIIYHPRVTDTQQASA